MSNSVSVGFAVAALIIPILFALFYRWHWWLSCSRAS